MIYRFTSGSMVLVTLLFHIIAISIAAPCVDRVNPFIGVETCDEVLDKCNRSQVKSRCPITCGMCTLDTINTSRAKCVDFPRKFKFRGQKKKKKCKQWKKFCGVVDIVDKKCPVTCDLCPCEDIEGTFPYNNGTKKCQNARNKPAFCKKEAFIEYCPETCKLCPTSSPTAAPTLCEDTKGKFSYNNGTKKCQNAKKNKALCRKEAFIENCPKTCGLCGMSPTKTPTKSPTSFPTSTPSSFPTTSPSSSPTTTPTSSPSSAPSFSPTQKTCDLTGKLAFPDLKKAPYYGYHSDR